MPRYRIELKITMQEIWEVEAEDEIEAEFHYMENPAAFIFDREEVHSELVKVYKVER
jgi:HJR/Mrr/RecB family endonuclease